MRSIKKILGASWVAFTYFAVRQPRVTVIASVGAVLVLAFIWQEVRPLTLSPEQIRAEEQEESQLRKEWDAHEAARQAKLDAEAQQTRALCRLKSICKQYGQVRQECAAAGSFQTCVRVKMGDENVGMIESCTSDGHIAYASEPGAVDCFFSKMQ